ncbi:YdcF family protein [Ileibacterium valens]|uniref:YdcF family protein n=1 Tax=Ileibacterium valens TaxID=1862668 RepID=UPI00272CC9A1|nr:YdcF family protein [Ileibacterium valens]
MISIIFTILFISIGFFTLVMILKPRSLLSGFSFVLMLICLLVCALLVLIQFSEQIAQIPGAYIVIAILAVIAMLILGFFPIMLILFLIVEGIKNIRHEGFRIPNLLSLGFGLFLIAYFFISPMILVHSETISLLYLIVSIAVGYFLMILSIYCLSAMLNTIHPFSKNNIDEIVVLGSGILKDKMTPLLKARVDEGIRLLNKQKDAKLILSGGQGPGEDIPESQAMAQYAIVQGVDPKLIVMEQESKNTHENLMYSRKLFRPESRRIAIVTTRYHVFRALILARRMNLNCKGYGSKTKWYFSVNAMLREFIGYLSLTWKTHLTVLAIFLAPLLLIALILFTF